MRRLLKSVPRDGTFSPRIVSTRLSLTDNPALHLRQTFAVGVNPEENNSASNFERGRKWQRRYSDYELDQHRNQQITAEDEELEQDIFNRMKQQLEQGNTIRIDHLLEYSECKSKALLPEVSALVYQTPIDRSMSSHVMSFFMRSGLPLDAIKVFNTMVSQGILPTVITFNILISALGRIGKINIAFEVLYQLKKEKLIPDKITIATINSVIFKTAMSPAGAHENLISARGALEEMRVAWEAEAAAMPQGSNDLKVQLKFLACLYNALLSTHAVLGDVEPALSLLSHLKKQKMAIEVTTLNLLMRALVKNGESQRAVALYEDEMKKGGGIAPTQTTYNLLLRQYSDLGRIDDAWAVLGRMRRRNMPGRRHAYNGIIAALVKAKQPERALSVFELMRSQDHLNGNPNLWTYNTILKCCHTKDEIHLKKAFTIYEEMKANLKRLQHQQQQQQPHNTTGTTNTTGTLPQHQLVPTSVTYHTMLNLCAKASQPGLAFTVFQEMKQRISPGPIAYNILINAYSRVKNVERAFAVREEMKAAGLVPDAITLSTLLAACVRAGDVKRAFSVYEEIDQSGLSVETCQSRLYGYARLGNIQKAMELKEEMLSKGLSPHLFGYNNLIHACTKAGDLKKALALFNEMKTRGVAPNATTYNLLMHESADQGSLDKALALYKEMKSEGVKPNAVTTTMLVHASCRVGDVEGALALFNEMREEGASLSPYTFNTLMDACARKGLMETAFNLLDEMKRGGFVIDVSIYNTLLAGCARRMWEERAHSLMEDMKAQGVAPDKASYTHMINACARNGNTHRALAVFEEMKENKLSPGFGNYAALIDACTHLGMVDVAFSLYEEMKQGKMNPDAAIYADLVDVCVKGGKLEKAFVVVEEMKKRGHKPDVVLYNALLGECVRTGWEEKAFNVLEEMSKASIEPDIVTFMTLIHKHAGEGLVEKAETILTDVLGQGVQPDKAFYIALIKASKRVGKYPKQVRRWQGELKKIEEKVLSMMSATGS